MDDDRERLAALVRETLTADLQPFKGRPLTNDAKGAMVAEIHRSLCRMLGTDATMVMAFSGLRARDLRAMGTLVDTTVPDEAELWCRGWGEPTAETTPGRPGVVAVKLNPIEPAWHIAEHA